MGVAVGIDLGTTNSCVAVVQGEHAKVVESVYGDRIHPSVVSFLSTGTTVAGPLAKERLAIDPRNTVYSFKRLLGQDLSDPEIAKLIASLPYGVSEKNGIPVVETPNREATLPEVSALMLRYLREMTSETYQTDIKDAIITVPANFTDVQRASTKIAGRIAGFNVLRILNEPTAAALAYGFGSEKEERIAVYDFGGGTFDITIIELLDDIFEVLSTAGDNFLGGDDFDAKLVHEMLQQFRRQFGFVPEDDPVAMQRIRSVAERVKCQLSSIDEVSATLREITTGKGGKKIDFSFSISRKRFEELTVPLVERTLATCEEALELAKLRPGDLDNVVLVGGTTRIPLVRAKVAEFFGKQPRTEVNPDEVVAIGAAINAYSLTQEALDPAIKPLRKQRPVAASAGQATGTKRPTAGGGRVDPFTADRSPLAASIDDPFADRTDVSKKTLGKIALSSKAMPRSDTARRMHTDLPARKEDASVDLPAPKLDVDADLPAPKLDVDADLPAPAARDSADTWADLSSPGEDEWALPAPAESGDGAAGDGAWLSAPKDQDPSSDGIEELDAADIIALDDELPVPKADGAGAEPPVPKVGGTGAEPPVPQADGAGAELPVPKRIDPMAPTVAGRPAPPVPPGPAPSEEFSVPPVLAMEPDGAAAESTADEFGAIALGAPPEDEPTEDAPIALGASDDAAADPFALPDEGAVGPDPFAVVEQQAHGRSDTTATFATFGHHPLDAVGDKEGREVDTSTHEAFSVPIKKTAPAVLLDVTPRGLGVATAGGYCDIIIERNAAIPVEQSRHFATSRDNQTEVHIDVYQGESRRTAENTQLGRIVLSGLRPAPRGAISILVTFEIDTDGILNVRAVNEETKESQSTRIQLQGGLEDDQVQALMEKYGNG